MSKEKRRVPKLRFPGFTEDWEQRKLGSIGSTYTGLSGKTKEDFGHGEAQYITYLNVFQNTISDITMTDKVEIDTTQNEVKYGDVLFTTSSETPEEVGMSSVWLGATPNIYLNSFCFGFRPNQKIDPYFLGYSLRAPYMRDKIKILAQGISRYNISKNKVMELEISLPNNEEQKLLGTFLQRIDLIITLHQRKLEHLNLKKKALLQKLFPKNGERYPELRFPGFADAWEQRKLIYIFNDFIVPMRDKPKVFSGTTPWTRIEDIEGRYINTSLSGQFVSDETIKSMNLKVIPKGSLIVSASATFGVVAIVNNDLITNQTFIGLVPNKDFDIDFLYSLFEAPTTKDKLLKLSAGSTIFYISRESFENLVLSVPSKEEQIKISKVFKSIDDSITLHQRKLEHLQLQKKALLQQLFI